MDYKFQINLQGLIDLLSNHLYSGQDVFIRELLQNGVDAITARRAVEPDHIGKISIELSGGENGVPATIIFQDDGIGLTEEEVHVFLATICKSSKRDEMFKRTGNFIGQFGIGILSCFLVSDEITVVTRSVKAGSPAFEWKGRADGTYSVKQLEKTLTTGTRVYLRCKSGSEEFFTTQRVSELAKHFGGLLPFPIFVNNGRESTCINETPPPWRAKFDSPREQDEALRAYCRETFQIDCFDAIPLQSKAGDVDGVAFVLPFKPSHGNRGQHRVYLRNMLLSEKADDLLPEWAFFVKCVLNANDLRPTASRESFYHDKQLESAREALGKCLRRYFVQLAEKNPRRMQELISLHYMSMKALAVDDDEFYRFFINSLPFETTLGLMTLLDCRERSETVRYVPKVDSFRQIAPIAAAQSACIINAGYAYDQELIEKLPDIFPEAHTEEVAVAGMLDRFAELSDDEARRAEAFRALAAEALEEFECACEIRKFKPADLPAMYIPTPDETLRRSARKAKDISNEMFSGLMDEAVESAGFSQAVLCFNFHNPLIERALKQKGPALKRVIRILYVQSILMGHHPLHAKEMNVLNSDLLGLVESSLNAGKGAKS